MIPTPCWQVLAQASLEPSLTAQSLGLLIKTLRAAVRQQGITGGLIFDGERLLLLMEGQQDELRRQFDWLAGQSVVEGVMVMAMREWPQAQFDRWLGGFSEPPAIESWAGQDDVAIESFMSLLRAADVR